VQLPADARLFEVNLDVARATDSRLACCGRRS
jgi:hypothetical protein